MKLKIARIKESVSSYYEQLWFFGSLSSIFLSSVCLVICLLLVDYFNLPSKLLLKYPLEPTVLFIILALAIIVNLLWNKYSIIDVVKLPSFNLIDSWILAAILSSCSCVAIYALRVGAYSYKTIALIIIGIISICANIIRIYNHTKVVCHSNDISTNVIDMKDVYFNTFTVTENQPILISEEDVDYDLLNRSALVNQLYKTITNIHSDNSFVVGLIGEWGSGKTTLINNVKKKLIENCDNAIIVDDFDPWIFGTQESLLISMYDAILKKAGIKFSVSRNRSFTKKLSSTVANVVSSSLTSTSWVKELFSVLSVNNDDDIAILKKELSMYLKTQGKTIIFIIDNIDRAESDNIILLFKLVSTIFDLPNIVYILSYDKSRVDDAMSDVKKINPKYIEKIVQQEIYVPTIQQDQIKNVYGKCIENILLQYGIASNDVATYIPIYNAICSTVTNLRSFKRLINSAFPSVFTVKHGLNKYQLLSIEVIRFLQPSLYESIRENRRYYISHHREFESDYYDLLLSSSDFNLTGKQYFDKLFETYPHYKSLLSSIFPYVKRYHSNQELRPKYLYDNKEEHRDVEKQLSICSAKYFDLYFSYGENEFLSLAMTTHELLASLKSLPENNAYKLFCNTFTGISNSNHKVWLETLYVQIDEIPAECAPYLAKAVWDLLLQMTDDSDFLALSARRRGILIISSLIGKSKIEEATALFQTCCDDLYKLEYASNILYWLSHMDSFESENILSIKNALKNEYYDVCSKIIENKISLYDGSAYRRNNVWGLINCYQNNENKDEILMNYFTSVFNPKHIYRYLADAISCSVGNNGYRYSYNSESAKLLCLSEDKINSAVSEYPPSNSNEELVLEIYRKYESGDKDLFGESSIMSPTKLSLEL